MSPLDPSFQTIISRRGHLLELCRHVVLNPMRARIALKRPWDGSSSLADSYSPSPIPAFTGVPYGQRRSTNV